jgi:hypothetical protein
MIRGVRQPFKFTTSKNFADIDHIEVTFAQHNNNGSTSAPLPITKYYDGKATKVDNWSEDGKQQDKTYYVDTTYYRYDHTQKTFVPSAQCPTESDLFGGIIEIYPIPDNDETEDTTEEETETKNVIYKNCVYVSNESYYQYDPDTKNWIITTANPNDAYMAFSDVGVENIPADADKKKVYVHNRHYYRYDGEKWNSSDSEILPIVTIPYWELSKINSKNEDKTFYYDRNKTYYAAETYYKYVDGAWTTYGRPKEVSSLNDENCDKSQIYMLKEVHYQHNIETNQFEQADLREVYYKYSNDDNKWVECDNPCAKATEIALWPPVRANQSEIYVCKNIYYTYNVEWKSSTSVLVPVIQIERWREEAYHDPSKVYMCPTKYYQYSIDDAQWKEFSEFPQRNVEILTYWSDQTNRNQNNIYFCGKTYFQYDSSEQMWKSSASFEVPLVRITQFPSEPDQSKVYECSPIYYSYTDGKWQSYTNIIDAVRNDGFAMVAGDSKSFVVELTSEETLRFNARHKGCVQAIVDDMSHPIQYFSIYPSLASGDNSYD